MRGGHRYKQQIIVVIWWIDLWPLFCWEKGEWGGIKFKYTISKGNLIGHDMCDNK